MIFSLVILDVDLAASKKFLKRIQDLLVLVTKLKAELELNLGPSRRLTVNSHVK
jgi:hypothetical protein